MKTRIAMTAALFGGICFATPSARADCSTSSGREYVFCDDRLFDEDVTGDAPMIPVRKTGQRVLINRPRIQFLPELLQSVENM